MPYVSIDEAIITYLKSEPSITALVGNRIYPLRALDRTYPYIVTQGGGIEHGLDTLGDIGDANKTISFHAVSMNYADVLAIQEAIRLLLQGFIGTLSGIEVVRCFTVDGSDRDFAIANPDGSNKVISQRSFDYLVSYVAPAVPSGSL